MIKLKSLIPEVRKLNLSKVEDAAEYMIRKTWSLMPESDRFSEYQLFLWMDSDSDLDNILIRLSQQFFPNEEEPCDKFRDVISAKLEQLEDAMYKRKAKKINSSDSLFVLKQIVRAKTWEGAKQSLLKSTLGAWGYKGGRISDEEAENAFNRLYKNAMGETVYDIGLIDRYGFGRLSDMQKLQIQGSNQDNIRQYTINIFIDHYTGHRSGKFPETVKVFRGTNNPTAKIRPGDFVTFDKDYADTYVRGKWGAIIKDVIPSKDLLVYRADINSSELVYWPEGHQIQKYGGPIPTFREFWEQWRSP